ncbi:MAG TPA: hypothetical protein VNZ64_09825 [Candidatus Acidoferrum sp.]|jgi:hypothetical protein|nr:hypothetical protein [Candidatus Acidoferrum sp.]
MIKFCVQRSLVGLWAVAVALFSQSLGAQTFFTYNQYGDLCAGFRKTGMNQANYELVVNIGSITNLEAVPAGSTISISNYGSSALLNAFSDLNNLQWSVSAGVPGLSSWAGFPSSTIWFTLPRTDPNTQTQPPARQSTALLGNVRQKIISIGSGAHTISQNLGTTNANNNALLVREPVGNTSGLSVFISDPGNPSIGDFGGYLPFSVENTTPASFTAAVVSDLYQAVPSGKVDPSTGLTTGSDYLVGTFRLATDGTMTFTRASTSQPPPPPLISIARTGNTSTVSFGTANGATYTLYYTNAAGLTAPASSWPASPATVVGNGGTNSLSDTTTDPVRFYRVGAH